jgi:hypothetical protein
LAEKIRVSCEDALKIALWLDKRGGVAVWQRINLSNLGSAFCPVKGEDGTPTQKPSWEYANAPERIVTDPADVIVFVPVVACRMHVAVRRSSNGLMLKLTDASSAKVRAMLEKLGEKSSYYFDYGEYKNCVFTVEGEEKPLLKFILEKETEKMG